MKRTLSVKNLVVIIVTTLLLAALAVSYLLLVQIPISKIQEEQNERRDKATMNLTVLTAKKAKYNKMQSDIEDMTKEYGTITVPSFDNLQKLMLFLDTAMTGASEYSFSFNPVQNAEENDTLIRRRVSMSFSCADFDTARTLIQKLRDCPYFCLIENISMTTSGPASKDAPTTITDGTVKVTLTATFFERAEKTGA